MHLLPPLRHDALKPELAGVRGDKGPILFIQVLGKAQSRRRACQHVRQRRLASHGKRGTAGVILGSVTAKVLAQAHVPVTVYR